MLVLVIFCTFATRNGDVEVLNKFDDYGIKKKHPYLGAFVVLPEQQTTIEY